MGMGRKVVQVSNEGGEEAAGWGEPALGVGEGVSRAAAVGGQAEAGFQVGLGTAAGVRALGARATALLGGGFKLTLTVPDRYRAVSEVRELATLPVSSSVLSTDLRANAWVSISDDSGLRITFRRTILAATSAWLSVMSPLDLINSRR